MARARQQLSDEARAARRAADRAQLEQAARALLTSDGWRNWVRVRGTNGLGRYSLRNQLLIALQRPDATFVAGFRAWLELDRCVRKGEKALRILAPMPIRRRDHQPDERRSNPTADDEPTRTLFKTVPVFDVSQVEPLPDRDPPPLVPPSEPITGDSHARLLEPLTALAAELGFRVTVRPLDGPAGGWCDPRAKEIVVDAGRPANARVRVLVHELAHALGLGYEDLGRERAEVLVDCVTHVVCAGAGLDVTGEAIPYVAGWGEDGALDAIQAYAATVDEVASRIQAAIELDEETELAEAA